MTRQCCWCCSRGGSSSRSSSAAATATRSKGSSSSNLQCHLLTTPAAGHPTACHDCTAGAVGNLLLVHHSSCCCATGAWPAALKPACCCRAQTPAACCSTKALLGQWQPAQQHTSWANMLSTGSSSGGHACSDVLPWPGLESWMGYSNG